MSELNPLKVQVGEFNLGEALLISLSKSTTERLMAPLVGNGTFMSGFSKLATGLVVGHLLKGEGMVGKAGNVIATGLVVDAGEDIINDAFKMFFGGENPISALFQGGSQQQANQVMFV